MPSGPKALQWKPAFKHRDLHRRTDEAFLVTNGLSLIFVFCSFLGPLNKTILILFGIYAAGGFAAFFRSWLYTLAGQRLVARLRKKVGIAVALKVHCRIWLFSLKSLLHASLRN